MQEWEERELDRKEALAEGIEKGQILKIKEQIQKKVSKGKSLNTIAEELEESPETIKRLME